MDETDVLSKKIRSAVTDSIPEITADQERIGLYNLLTIFHLATGKTQEDIASDYRNSGMKELKDDLVQALDVLLAPIQMKINQYLDEEDELIRIIKNGSEKAHKEAKIKLEYIHSTMGISI